MSSPFLGCRAFVVRVSSGLLRPRAVRKSINRSIGYGSLILVASIPLPMGKQPALGGSGSFLEKHDISQKPVMICFPDEIGAQSQ